MSKRALETAAAVLLGSLTLAACGASDPSGDTANIEESRPPNIVLILADDLGYADVSTYTQGRIATPNIDQIGKQGVVFTQGYATTPVCSPARAGLMTGRYQQRFGFEYNARQAADVPDVGLVARERTIADMINLHSGLRRLLFSEHPALAGCLLF